MAEYVDDLTKQKEKTNEKAAFHDFIKASGGKSFVFCQSQEEISDFLLNKMGYGLKEALDIPRIHTETGAMLMANPHTGLHIQFKLCECIKSPDNPNYNKEEAEKKRHYVHRQPKHYPLPIELHPARRRHASGCLSEQFAKKRIRARVHTQECTLPD